MHTLVLSTGSNLGNRKENMESALLQIEKYIGKIIKFSAMYESSSWGYNSENRFYNQCVLVKTDKGLGDCLALSQEIENRFGRERVESEYHDRILDIDILFYNEIIMETDLLQVPHPRMHKRKFVLIPLAEILPEMVHPVYQKTVRELLEQCEDPMEVQALNPGTKL
jgi:2-amino-4-hydroxy-6-hydroxymethyldihydropteridine diphosphokinase